MKQHEYRLTDEGAARWRRAHEVYVEWVELKKHLENHRKIAKARAEAEGASDIVVLAPDGSVLDRFKV